MATPNLIMETSITRQRANLRQRIDATLNMSQIFKAIDSDPDLTGAGVVYIDSRFNVIELRKFEPLCRLTPVKIIIREAPELLSAQQFASDLQENRRDANLVAEAVGAGLACTGAILGWVAVLAGTTAIPFTGGASSVATTIGVSAAMASTLQCINSAHRTYNSAYIPDQNDTLDSNLWYRSAVIALDLVALSGVATAGMATARMVLLTQKATGKSTYQTLQGLNRQQRTMLTRELLQHNNPSISNAIRKGMQRAGQLPKRYTNTEIRKATLTQITDALSGTFSLLGSSHAGTVRSIAIGLYEEASSWK